MPPVWLVGRNRFIFGFNILLVCRNEQFVSMVGVVSIHVTVESAVRKTSIVGT